MKNAMKKIMSLMLVAVLLISAVPFQASAAENEIAIQWYLVDNAEDNAGEYFGETKFTPAGDTFTANNVKARYLPDGYSKYDYKVQSAIAEGNETRYYGDDAINADCDLVYINVYSVKQEEPKETEPKETEPKETEPKETEPKETEPKETEPKETEPKETEPKVEKITLKVKKAGSDKIVFETTEAPAKNGTAKVSDMLTYWYHEDWADSYTCTKAWSTEEQGDIGVKGTVTAPDTVTVILTPIEEKETEKDETTDDTTDDDFEGYYPNGGLNGYILDDTYYGNNGGTEVNKWPYSVNLIVYRNNQIGTIDAQYNITDGIALDGKVTMSEVKKFLKNYYVAKDSDGLILDGLYFASGNWVGKFAYDLEKVSTLYGLDEERKDHEMNIIVMLTNANRKTTTTSTSDNPKTGDSIFMTASVMGLSATALVALYFFNKKRAF